MSDSGFVMVDEIIERIGVAPAIGMAMMEKLGIIEYLDSISTTKSDFTLGKRIKAMCGPMFTGNQRQVLSALDPFYGYAPVESLFGTGHESMNDQSFGRALDEIWELDPVNVYYNVASRAKAQMHMGSNFYHFDASNMTVYKVPGSEPDPAVPVDGPEASFGKPKDHSVGKMQFNFESVVDENGLPLYVKLHKGNETDGKMLMDALKFMEKQMQKTDFVAIADCKMVYAEMVDRLIWDGIPFISKCPDNFGDSAKKRAIGLALEKGFVPVGKMGKRKDSPEFEASDIELDVNGDRLRFIAYRETGFRHTFDYYRNEVEKHISKSMKSLMRKEFNCRPDTEAALAECMGKLAGLPFDINTEIISEERPVRGTHRGRPRKDEVKQFKTVWKIQATWKFNEALALTKAIKEDIRVIITSIPQAESTSEDLSEGATCRDVLLAYFGQWRVEDVFRDFKSRLGADTVYLQNAHREAAFIAVVAIATLVRNFIKFIVRKAEEHVIGLPKNLTPLRIFRSVQNSDIRAGRDAQHPLLDGPVHERNFAVMVVKVLELDPARMLG